MQAPEFNNTSQLRQELLLNQFGDVIKSDNQLFPIKKMANLSAIECFPLVASMFNSLLDLELDNAPVTVPGVAPTCDFLDGFFDFSFSKIGTKNNFQIKWIIEDCTAKYTYLKEKMQIHNDAVIQAERDRCRKKH